MSSIKANIMWFKVLLGRKKRGERIRRESRLAVWCLFFRRKGRPLPSTFVSRLRVRLLRLTNKWIKKEQKYHARKERKQAKTGYVFVTSLGERKHVRNQRTNKKKSSDKNRGREEGRWRDVKSRRKWLKRKIIWRSSHSKMSCRKRKKKEVGENSNHPNEEKENGLV